LHALSLAIVGIPYANKSGPTRRFGLELCAPGDPLQLRPEPKNPADEHAVAVYSAAGIQLGYISSERAVLIGKFIREGKEVRAIYQGRSAAAAWCRVAFDGADPVLPEQKPKAEPEADGEPEFWPDEIWPDE
jgi:hypothetical protein